MAGSSGAGNSGAGNNGAGGNSAARGAASAGEDWRPCAAAPLLRRRAALLARLRAFMAAREILEVETPLLCAFPAAESQIRSFRVVAAGGEGGYLRASPESDMKRLLAAGLGPIYQLGRVFRRGERSPLHEPEFTVLEWYRPGFDQYRLMDEVAELLRELGLPAPARLSYRDAFRRYAGLDPWTASAAELAAAASAQGLRRAARRARRENLDLLLAVRVGPRLGRERPQFLCDFPADQALQAHVAAGDPPVAERFELFVRGVEIADGCRELTDAAELERRLRGGSRRAPDTGLLAAVRHGLPEGAGVALGVDRLLLTLSGAERLAEVIAFPWAFPRERQRPPTLA